MAVVAIKPINVGAVLDRLGKVDVLPLLFLLVDAGPVPPEMPLANHLGMVSSLLEEVGDGGPLGGDQVVAGSPQHTTGQAGAPIVASGQHAVSGGRADGAGGMGVEKGDPLVGHLLQMGGLYFAVRISRRNVPDPEVIGEDEHNVGQLVVISVEKAARDEQRE